MNQSIYQIKKIEQLKKKAIQLYKQGWTTRQIAPVVKRSHQWVALAVKPSVDKLQDLTRNKGCDKIEI